MKKKWNALPWIKVKKVNYVKKLFFLILFSLTFQLQISAEGNQDPSKQISLSFNNEKLSSALKKLEKASGYKLIFNYEDVEPYKVNASFVRKNVRDILDAFFVDKPFIYSLQSPKGVIIITERLRSTNKMRMVSGQVLDVNRSPLPGVNIMVLGIPQKSVTDENGNYIVQISENSNVTLVYSFVGMKQKELRVKSSFLGSKLNTIILEEDSKMMREVVVTGYQVLDKTRIAGAVSAVSSKDLYLNGVNTLEQALQGALPGVVVTNTSGLVGVRQQTRVRGTSTLAGSQDPIWVVDDVIQEDPLPFNTQTFNSLGDINSDNFDYIRNYVGNSISWLNPNDIESLTVLKDASATAIYGVRAANGVIVIKTKRGKEGVPSVSYSMGLNFGERVSYDRLGMMNSKERVDVSREIFDRGLTANWTNNSIGYAGSLSQYLNKEITYDDFNSKISKLETTNTDWFKILFRNPLSHNHSASISGGNDKTRYFASIGYNSTMGTAIGNSSGSYSGRMGLDMNVSSKLKVSFNLAGANNTTNGFNIVSPYLYASTVNRSIQAYDDNGDLFYYKTPISPSIFLYNFINERDQSGSQNKTLTLNSSLNVNYNLNKNVRLQSLFSFNTSSTKGTSYATERTAYIAAIRNYDFGTATPVDDAYKLSKLPRGGEYNDDNNRSTSWSWRNTISYDKIINKVHAITTMLGVDISSTKYNGFSTVQYGYLRDRGESFATVPMTYGTTSTYINDLYTTKFNRKITDRLTNNIASYLTVNYAYDNRYVLNLSVRADASNRFGRNTNENFNPVWAGGLRWNVGREKWFKPNPLISDLSLRASLGYQRNLASNYSPNLIVKIPTGASSNITDVNTGEDLLSISKLPYSNLRWEKIISSNYGLDLSLIDNKIRLSFETYRKIGKDMIVSLQVPEEYGVTNMPINGGSMDNHGYEITLNITPVRTKNFTWNLGLNTSKNINKITKVGIQNPTWRTAVGGNLHKEGYSSSGFWAFKFTGIDQTTGYPIIDLTTKDGVDPKTDPTAYMEYVGSNEPDFTSGLNTSFRYKNLSLTTNFYIQLGGKRFLSPAYKTTVLPSEYENLSSELNARWRPGDTNAMFPGLPDKKLKSIPLPGVGTYINYYEMYNYSTARVVSASTLRCNNISLSYMFPQTLTKKLYCKNLAVSCSASNLFAIVSKDFKGRDSEVSTGAQPRTRSYSLNINVTF